ncbi:hypothetical protein F66182_218 [Fusarium sp. NRRL 66182]|nr:hypothetical protein F66182_218 [Fusarium sp. NRRL 66182]
MSTSDEQVKCSQNIALLYCLGRIGCSPQKNCIQGREVILEAGTNRTLSLEDEKLLTSTLAFLSSIQDDAQKITAVGVEERASGLVVMVAANAKNCDGSSSYLNTVKQGFDKIFGLLQQASRLHSECLYPQVLSAIISMCRSRILARARFTKRGQKQNIHVILKKVEKEMARLTLDDDKISFIALSQVLISEMEAFQRILVLNSSNTAASDKHLELIVKAFADIGKIPSLEAILVGQVGSRMDPCLCPGLLNTIRKLANYHSSACTLVKLAKRYSLLGNVSSIAVTLDSTAFTRSEKSAKRFNLGEHLRSLKTQHNVNWNLSDLGTKLGNNQKRFQQYSKAIKGEPKIHAEIQLMWYLERHPNPKPPRIIASNKDACFLCNAFISFHGGYMIPRTHGRIYPGWRLPSNGLDEARSRFPQELERIAVNRLDTLSRQGLQRVNDPFESTVSLAAVSVFSRASDSQILEHSTQTEIQLGMRESTSPTDSTHEPVPTEISGERSIETYPTQPTSVCATSSKPLDTSPIDDPCPWKQVEKNTVKRIPLAKSLTLHVEYATSDPCTSQSLKFKARRLSVDEAAAALEEADPVHDLNSLTTEGCQIGNCRQMKLRAGTEVYVVDLELVMPSYARERHIAELAVLRASILTKKVQSTVSGISKADDSPVTAADFAAQAVLISALRKAFPGDAFVGEEDSSALRDDEALRQRVWELASDAHLENADDEALIARPQSADELLEVIDLGGRGQGGRKGRFWVMDPIDGTATFLRGEQYAVSLALIEDGQEVVGVLGCANLKPVDGRVAESTVDKEGLGLMLTAVRGQGTTIRIMNFDGLQQAKPLESVSKASPLADAQIINYSSNSTSRHDLISKLASSFGAKFPNMELYSSHIRYAALLVGGGDLQLRVPSSSNVVMWIWDHAGAQLILTEAGGKVTDLDGKAMDFGAGRDLNQNRGLIATRGEIHGAVLEGMGKLLAEDASRGMTA